MRKQNSAFKTAYISEAGKKLRNNDYFAFVELDQFACYVLADGISDMPDSEGAKLAAQSVILRFQENPSIKRRALRSYLKAANRELLDSKEPNRLKASVLVVVTDYAKIRYAAAGNTRLRIYREGSVRLQSADLSLTREMADEELLPFDILQQHEERGNLYAYLGQERGFHPYISNKFKLMNADSLLLYTRGVWENLGDGDFEDVMADATDDPKAVLDNVEDLLLSGQPEGLENYTCAAIFADKIYLDPNRKKRIKKIVIISVIVLVVLLIVGLVVFFVLRDRAKKREDMNAYLAGAVEYIEDNNFVSAKDDAKKAYELAEKLRDKEMKAKIGAYQKLIEGILSADGLLTDSDYKAAQAAFLSARERSRFADNSGAAYITEGLEKARKYMEVYDLIAAGDLLAEQGNYAKAEEKYNEAKKLAGNLYFAEGKQAAIDALDKIYEKLSEEEAARKEEAAKVSAQTQSAADLMAQGDKSMQDKDYDAAQTSYTLAKEKFEELGDQKGISAINEKLAQAKKKLEERDALKAMAEQYAAAGEEALKNKDPAAAKKYNDLAKGIYADLGLDDLAKQMDEKLALEDPEAAAALAEASGEGGGSGGSGGAGGKGDTSLTAAEKKEMKELAKEKEKKGDKAFDDGDYLKAKKYYREARDLYKQLGQDSMAEDMEDKMQEAQDEYDRILQGEVDDTQEQLRQAQAYADMGDDARRAGDIEEAIAFYRKARNIYLELGKTGMAQLMQDKIDYALNVSSSSVPDDSSSSSRPDESSSNLPDPPSSSSGSSSEEESSSQAESPSTE